MESKRSTLNSITKRLSVLLGGAAVASVSHASAPPVPITVPTAPNLQSPTAAGVFKLPAKLILKQKKTGFRMIAQHDSHSSHASHASHSSHSSSAF